MKIGRDLVKSEVSFFWFAFGAPFDANQTGVRPESPRPGSVRRARSVRMVIE